MHFLSDEWPSAQPATLRFCAYTPARFVPNTCEACHVSCLIVRVCGLLRSFLHLRRLREVRQITHLSNTLLFSDNGLTHSLHSP